MKRLSSNSTLALKIFLPVFWVTFFGVLVLAFLLADYQGSTFLKSGTFKVILVMCYLIGCLGLYLTFWKLKRVEADEFFIYVTDYFRTARYPFHSIIEIKTAKYPFFNLAVIQFKEKGIFGKKAYFIHKSEAFERVVLHHPELMEKVRPEEI